MRAPANRVIAGASAGLLLAIGFGAWMGTGYTYSAAGPPQPGRPPHLASESDARAPKKIRTELETRRRRLQTQLDRTAPPGHYLVVDQTHNRLYLKKGRDTVLMAICSAGSGATLSDPEGSRKWVFATPRGRFEVLSRLRNPVWKKPDWAFIEEGEPVPSNPSERFEYGVLGEYALYFGDGYMIHGTLYERLLGRSVTHGCIRLGRDDLRTVYAATRLGTPIYIF